MAEFIKKINDINIFAHEYEKWKGHEKVNSLTAEGVAFRFYRFLQYKGIINEYDTIEDVWGNLSEVRDNNRIDIHDDYRFSWDDEYENLYINFLYIVNGNVWGVLYDKANNSWYGDFEIPGNV